MVRRMLNIVYKEVRGLHQAAYVLALFAFGSQLLALVRDRLLAHQFGAGYELDVYYAAFRIPDLLYVLFASTLSVYVLIPFVARAQKKKAGDREARQLLSQVFSLFLVSYAVLAVIIAVCAPRIVEILFPALASDSDLVLLLRILLLQPLFLGISSLFGVVTQLGHRFVLYALSPLIYNVGIIFGIVVLEPIMGLSGLAVGVVLGACGHMAIQAPLVARSTLRFSFIRSMRIATLRPVLATSIPRALTLSLNQIVLLIFVSLASVMAIGSVSVFQFAYNLQSVPLAVIGVSYSVAAFPILAELVAKRDLQSFNIHIATAFRHIIFWALPAIALVIVLRAHIVRVVLGSGAFDWSDTRLTAAVLAVLALSLVAQAYNLLAIRAFYAGGYTKIPFYAALTGAVVAVLSALGALELYEAIPGAAAVIASIMRLSDVIGVEVLVLSIGFSFGMLVQTCLLLYMLKRTYTMSFRWLPAHALRSSIAALVAALCAYATLNFVVDGINPNTFMGIFIQGVLGGIAGIVGAYLGYSIVHSPELSEIRKSFRRKLFKTDVVAPQEEIL